MRRLEARLLAIQAFHPGGHQPRGEQRALDRIGGLAGQKHLFHVVHQRVEEVGQRGAPVGHGQIHLRGEGFAPALDVRGEVEVLHQWREDV